MKLLRHYPLKRHNTFSIDAFADFYSEFDNTDDLKNFIRSDYRSFEKCLILGGGSNLLFLGDFQGLVLAVRNTGVEFSGQEGDRVLVTAQAGEKWESLVDKCTDAGLCGLQNLALIPGNAGSAPIQNIGAYGSEVKDVFHRLRGIFLDTGEEIELSKSDCNFGYRDSIFKNELKNRFLITSITLELRENAAPDVSYRAVSDVIQSLGISNPGIKDVRDIVAGIRRSKLPDPGLLGNAGSFFKNPVIHLDHYGALLKEFPDIIAFPQGNDQVKLAAGWLIEACGWKGKRKGDAGVHEKQALVLVNYGNATGRDIINLSQEITRSVFEKFRVELTTEVNIIE
jgi:UDP-N-acetylmuramate dehydrogenase